MRIPSLVPRVSRAPCVSCGLALAAAVCITLASGHEPARAEPLAALAAQSGPALAAKPAATLIDELPGTWNGEQKTGSVLLLESAKWAWTLERQFLEGAIETSDPVSGKVVYQARALLRIADGRATLHWFDSHGEARRYEGAQDGDALSLARESVDGRETVTIAMDGEGVKMTFSRGAAGGRPATLVESSYKRAIERTKKKKPKDKDGG